VGQVIHANFEEHVPSDENDIPRLPEDMYHDSQKKLKEKIDFENHPEFEEVLFAEGFESALIGIGQRFSHQVAIYDREACIKSLMSLQDPGNISIAEAEEYFEVNVVGAYVGDNTPVFVDFWTKGARDVIKEHKTSDDGGHD
jgi:hypothetical protein